MTPEQAGFLAKARESLAAARLLLENGYTDFAASRAYYAMFYLASAVLLEKNLRFKKHSAVHAAFGREFARTGLVPAELQQWLVDAANARHAADYAEYRKVAPSEALTHIERAERFLETVSQVLGKTSPTG
jgi:uncharacterized protein (UPF0332 family)